MKVDGSLIDASTTITMSDSTVITLPGIQRGSPLIGLIPVVNALIKVLTNLDERVKKLEEGS